MNEISMRCHICIEIDHMLRLPHTSAHTPHQHKSIQIRCLFIGKVTQYIPPNKLI